ncbi:MAG: alpha/beta fold hydrolase [Candidatus Paceibacterota bacterium]|jgi:hypothetical protein
MKNKIFFKSKDGIKLCGVWNIPARQTKKAIILVHGITVNKNEDGVFTSLAKILCDHGYAVLRFGFRGHGESSGKSIDMTINGEILDLDASVKEAIKNGYSEIGLVGASFGGGVATLYTAKNQEKIKCLCLWNPCLNYDHCFLNPTLPWLINKKDKMKADLRKQGWTTLGRRKFVLGKKLFGEMAKLHPDKEIRKIEMPLEIIHGDKDTYIPYNDSKKSLKNMKNGQLVTIKNGEHGFHEPKAHTQKANEETLKFFKKYL